jgi:predicted MFS family arabinose efflux permease
VGAKVYTKTKHIKLILTVCLVITAITLTIFASVSNFEVALLMRMLSGFFEVFITIFTPVWADTFGPQKEKSIWMTGLLTCPTFGIFIGFTLTSIFNVEASWELTFYL